MAINVETVNEVVNAIAETGSIVGATSTITTTDSTVLGVLGAVQTLASQAVNNPAGNHVLGGFGAAFNIANGAVEFSDGEFTLDDIAAAAGIIGSALSRAPNPVAQGFAAYFNALALAPSAGRWLGEKGYLDPIFDGVHSFFDGALSWVQRRDPLVLDLDGDGIETLPANGAVLFDHDGDGVKNATGWIHSDDGILVLDRDGNGTVDSGLELFGDSTVKSDGSTATDGFDALTDLDANGDGLVDANDAQFSDLRVWRDLNADGVSQSGELFTLDELNIQSIGTASEATNTNLGDGNVATAEGSFTFTDGETGSTGTAANLDLASNNFYREFSDTIAIPDEISHLPDLAGSGAVRDLKEAAALSANVASLVGQYSQAATKAEQLGLIDELIQAWADSGNFNKLVDRIDDATLSDGIRTLGFRITKSQDVIDAEYAAANSGGGSSIDTSEYYDDDELKVGAFADRRNVDVLAKIQVLEVFNNQEFFNFNFEEQDTNSDNEPDALTLRVVTGNTSRTVQESSGTTGVLPNEIFIDETDLVLSQQQMNFIEQAYDALVESIYEGLSFQTRLKPYTDAISLQANESGELGLDFSDMNALLNTNRQTNEQAAYIDLVELNLFSPSEFHASGWGGVGMLRTWVDEAAGDTTLTALLSELGVISGEGSLTGSGNADILFGQAGNDYLYGNNGNDTLDGGAGSDYLFGGAGNDTLRGGAGTGDYLSGAAGNDTYLFGLGDGNTTVYNYDTGANRQDKLQFLAGINASDVVATRSSSNLLLTVQSTGEVVTVQNFFSNSNYELNAIEFADGTSWDAANIKAAVQQGSAGNDQLHGYAGDDTLDGLGGSDTIYGADGNDTLSGGDGNDSVQGQEGDDTVFGDAGNDYLYGNNGNDTLDGGAGSDYLFGGAGNDTLRGGAGTGDYLSGDAGNDTYLFGLGDGNTTVYNYDTGANRQDKLQFLAGINASDVVATRSSSNLLLTVQSTGEVVTVQNFFSNSNYELNAIEFADGASWDAANIKAAVQQGSAGNDQLHGYAGDDTLDGLGGSDTIYGADGNDTLSGGDGNDSVQGQEGDDTVFGDAGNDYLYGNNGNDTLDGGAGSDYLFGGAGNDTLRGGAGTGDYLSGDAGNDTYLFGLGDGNTTVYNYDTGANRQDKLQFLAGINASDVVATRSSSNLLLTVQSTGEVVTVQNFFSNSNYELNAIEFADGASWDATTIKGLVLGATEGADNITGYATDDVINSLGGNDTLYGADGNDTLSGGDGNDSVQGQEGDDTVFGDAGNDYLYGNNGNDTLDGGAGSDYLFGGAGNDTLRGGAGTGDYLSGAAGNDTYLFGLGDGNTTVYNYDTGANRQDKLQFLAGINASDVVATRSSSNLLLTVQSTGEVVTVQNFFSNSNYELNAIEFADGTSWDAANIKAAVQQGSAGNDQLHGYAGDDTLDGLGGSDTIYGADGNDTLSGGDGNDSVQGQEGDDTVFGDAGNDYLYGNNGNDTLDGGAGSDYLFGGAGNDTLRGGAGTGDYLSGDAGNDTYLFGLGDGNTTVYNYDTGANRQDKLQFLAGINASDVVATRSSSNLLLTVQSTGEVVTVQNFFSNSNYELNAIEFADGTSWDAANIKAAVQQGSAGNDQLHGYAGDDTLDGLGGSDTIYGADGNDTLSGGDGNDSVQGQEGDDTVFGDAGNDYLYGNNGNDTLDGGAGSDYLFGGAGNDTLRGGAGTGDYLSGDAGNDTYLFGLGDGNTTVYNYDTGANRQDKLQFLAGINASDVVATRSSSNLLLTVQSTGEVVTVQNFFSNSNYELNAIEFADGTSWDAANIKAAVQQGSAGNDQLHGYAGDDTLDGLGGSDTIYGADGNDTLSGGDGNDSVQGQEGDDTVFGDAGNDYLYGNNGNDTLDGGAGSDYLFGGAGNDTLRGGAGTGDYLSGDAGNDTYLFGLGDGNTTVYNYDTGANRQDKLQFLAGINASDVVATRSSSNLLLTVQSTGEVVTVQNFFSNSNYELNAIEFADGTSWDAANIKAAVQQGSAGNDQLHGYAGDDTLDGLGGSDTIYGADGNDTLSGGDGNDSVQGQEGDDTVFGDAGNDYLYGNNGNDTLDGGAGTDYLFGGAGNDTLRGGAGTGDYLSGDAGNDTYLFGLGDGNTTVYNYDTQVSSVDVAKFESVTSDELWFSRSGNNLQIDIVGTDDQVTVSNWYSGASYQLDQIETASSVLLNSQVDQLVQTMASFSAGEPTSLDDLTSQQQSDLNTAIAAAWQTA